MTTRCDDDPFVIVVAERPRASEVIALYGAAGWGSADDYDEDAVQSALVNTMCVIHAADRDGRLIGFARLFGDGIFHTSLAEIIVHPKWQGKGVGTAMLSKACELCAGTAIFWRPSGGRSIFSRVADSLPRATWLSCRAARRPEVPGRGRARRRGEWESRTPTDPNCIFAG